MTRESIAISELKNPKAPLQLGHFSYLLIMERIRSVAFVVNVRSQGP